MVFFFGAFSEKGFREHSPKRLLVASGGRGKWDIAQRRVWALVGGRRSWEEGPKLWDRSFVGSMWAFVGQSRGVGGRTG
jgi:hypothetical protein